MPDIFVSYSSKDRYHAERLVSDLRVNGISVWYDQNELLVGHNIVDQVYDGIRNSTYLAIILTPHSVVSQWVREEMTFAKVREIEEGKVRILPLLFERCDRPDALRAKKYADFLSDYGTGLNEILRLFKTASFPKGLGEEKIELEDLVNQRIKHINDTATALLDLEQIGERTYALGDDFHTSLEELRDMVDKGLNLLDHLISIEDSTRLLLHHHWRAAELANILLNYDREVQYLEFIVDRSPVSIDNLFRQAVANAGAGHGARAIDAFRRALRLFFEFEELEGEDDSRWRSALVRFVYRITRHVRLEFMVQDGVQSQLFRDLVVLKDREKLVYRLNSTLACVDEALERELIFDFSKGYGCFNYGILLNYIGLTKHAVDYFKKAKKLGLTDSVFGEASISLRDLERLNRRTAAAMRKDRQQELDCHAMQVANLLTQFGAPPDSFERIAKKMGPGSYAEFVENDSVFWREKPGLI
jgi:tetratricopeptide (TPR) repeat protein